MLSKAYYTTSVWNLTLPRVSTWAQKKERKPCRHQIRKWRPGISLSANMSDAMVREVNEFVSKLLKQKNTNKTIASVWNICSCLKDSLYQLRKKYLLFFVLFTTLTQHYTFAHLRDHAVAQLVEALRYMSEGRGFDSRWCHWNFSLK